MAAARCTSSLPDEAVAYLRDKHIPDLMEHLLHELIVHQPEDPLTFLSKVLCSPVVLKVILCAPPAGGKRTQGSFIAEKFGLVKIDAVELLNNERLKGSPQGKEIESYTSRRELVPDAIIADLILSELKTEEATAKGWVLIGFPRTRSQALLLQSSGCIPQALISLSLPTAVVLERSEGRRTDPETGKIYHLAFDPPTDPEVAARLQVSANDTRERCLRQVTAYERNIAEVEAAYRSCLHKIDAAQEKEGISEQISEILMNLIEK